jgi:predicted MFS family arabinose efflux permease
MQPDDSLRRVFPSPTRPWSASRLAPHDLAIVVVALLLTHVAGMAAFLTVPVLAPALGGELGVSLKLAGVYTAVCYLGYVFTSPFTGGLVARLGGIRTCQLSLLGIAGGMAVATLATPETALPVLALSAFLAGLGHGPLTATGTQVLHVVAPVRRRALLFSLKQSGTPLGVVLIGALTPGLAQDFGWRAAILGAAFLVLAIAALMQPLRRRHDALRDPQHKVTLTGAFDSLRLFREDSRLRALTLAAMAYGCSQFCFSAFFVVFQVEALEISHVDAGINLSIAQMAGAAGRVLWGVVADQWKPWRVLIAIGLATAGAGLCLALADAEWPGPLITAAAMAMGATAIGWNGVLLSETARTAPDRAAAATGMLATLFAMAMVVAPTIFSALVSLTGSYVTGFMACAVMAALGAGALIVVPRHTGTREPARVHMPAA